MCSCGAECFIIAKWTGSCHCCTQRSLFISSLCLICATTTAAPLPQHRHGTAPLLHNPNDKLTLGRVKYVANIWMSGINTMAGDRVEVACWCRGRNSRLEAVHWLGMDTRKQSPEGEWWPCRADGDSGICEGHWSGHLKEAIDEEKQEGRGLHQCKDGSSPQKFYRSIDGNQLLQLFCLALWWRSTIILHFSKVVYRRNLVGYYPAVCNCASFPTPGGNISLIVSYSTSQPFSVLKWCLQNLHYLATPLV